MEKGFPWVKPENGNESVLQWNEEVRASSRQSYGEEALSHQLSDRYFKGFLKGRIRSLVYSGADEFEIHVQLFFNHPHSHELVGDPCACGRHVVYSPFLSPWPLPKTPRIGQDAECSGPQICLPSFETG